MLAFSLAFVLGTLAACNIGRPIDRIVTGISVIGVSVPNYWLGIVLIIVFAVQLGLAARDRNGLEGLRRLRLRPMGAAQIRDPADHHHVDGASRRHHAQHALGGGGGAGAGLRADAARQGPRRGCGLRHAVRNALPQILAVMGLQFGYLVGGSILIETIFTWPGTGFLLSKAILTRDIPLLQGTILILSLSFVATNLVVDLMQTAVDPRIKRA